MRKSEYRMRSGDAGHLKTALDHWILCMRKQGVYRWKPRVADPGLWFRARTSGIKCWIGDSDLLFEMANEDRAVIELEKFKQYRKLVPELSVAS